MYLAWMTLIAEDAIIKDVLTKHGTRRGMVVQQDTGNESGITEGRHRNRGYSLLTCVGGGGGGAYTYTTLEGGGGLGEMLAEY